MSDQPNETPEVIVHEIPWGVVEAVLHSEEEFDGFEFGTNGRGTVVFYYGGPWVLHLFLLSLAHAMGPVLEPERQGYQQIYHALAELTMNMPLPVPAPDQGKDYYSCQLPNVRIEWP